ncbi:MAG TPA: glycosyl transferase group 1 [Lachnospiraceae bacterium]|nr:glycosyl transferase group 1 [Lachnospiraceae bacterium]
MIRIAYVINYIVKNGPSSVVLNLIDNLDRLEYDISLITLFEGNNAEVVSTLRNNSVTVYECGTLSRMKCLLGQSKEFSDVVEKGNFDILHTHGIIPDILSSRLNTAAKCITTLHNNMYEDYLDTYGYIKSRIFIEWHLSALRKLDKCVCCSKSVYDVMKRQLPNVSFVRNGIEPAQANSIVTRDEVNVPEDAQVFLYAGVLNSRKNIVWLIDNFVQYHRSNEYLLVLGNGGKEAECKAKADDHVRMLGFQTDPIAYMNISDVYVSASKSEGFSISVLEALSCGLELFLSNIPSHEEVVSMGRTIPVGELFDEKNIGGAFDNIRSIHSNKDKIIEFQRENLSACKMAELYNSEYQKIERTQ